MDKKKKTSDACFDGSQQARLTQRLTGVLLCYTPPGSGDRTTVLRHCWPGTWGWGPSDAGYGSETADQWTCFCSTRSRYLPCRTKRSISSHPAQALAFDHRLSPSSDSPHWFCNWWIFLFHRNSENVWRQGWLSQEEAASLRKRSPHMLSFYNSQDRSQWRMVSNRH